jgi:dihydroflavonol-4-reductase
MTVAMAAPGEVARAGPVLVTGASGFLGANLVWALREHGLAVRALVRRPPRGPKWQGIDGVEFIRGDVCDAAAVARAVRGAGGVIHAAALTEVIPRPRRRSFRVNVEGTRHVCVAALRGGVRRLVLTSSAATVARGSAAVPATEDSPYNLGDIRAPYYISKRLAERTVQEFGERGLETIILCPTYVIGPRDDRPTTNRLLLYLARSRWPVAPPGGMNLLDVRTAALAHVRALWLGRPGARYLLAGPYCSYAGLGAIAQAVRGTRRPVRVLPRWAYWPGALALALAAGVLPRLPEGVSLPNFQYGFVPFHVSGARGDAAFRLEHPPVAVSVFDTLRWFQRHGLAPWLSRPLLPPPEASLTMTGAEIGHPLP